jgi:hypothetical protein
MRTVWGSSTAFKRVIASASRQVELGIVTALALHDQILPRTALDSDRILRTTHQQEWCASRAFVILIATMSTCGTCIRCQSQCFDVTFLIMVFAFRALVDCDSFGVIGCAQHLQRKGTPAQDTSDVQIEIQGHCSRQCLGLSCSLLRLGLGLFPLLPVRTTSNFAA